MTPPVATKFVDLAAFRAAALAVAKATDEARPGLAATLATLAPMKAVIPQIKVVNEAERIIRFTISTASVDRMGDTIAVSGWDLNDFIRGGQPVLFGHDRWSPVVGRGVATSIGPEGLISDCQFTPRDLNPFGFMIYGLYAADYMRATSVGFLPLEYSFAEDRGAMGGINFIRQQLLEYSMVPVPANPDCLSHAKAAGIDVAPMKAWASKSLDLIGRAEQAASDAMLAEHLTRLRAVCDDQQIRYFIPSEADDMDPALTTALESLTTAVKAIPETVGAAVAAALKAQKTEGAGDPATPPPPAEEPPATPAAEPAPVADPPPATEAPAAVDPAAPAAPVEAAAGDGEHVLMLDHEIEIGVDVTADEVRALIAETTREAVMQATGNLG